MVAELLYRESSGKLRRFAVAGEVVLGSERGISVQVGEPGVSRRHARILQEGEDYYVEDLKSVNGTFVNGTFVGAEKLQHLDVIGLGKRADLVFVIRSNEAPKTREGILEATLVPMGPIGREEEPKSIGPGETTLGRSPICNIILDNRAVSKVHARLERSTDALLVTDLRSANGTLVNGVAISVASLNDGDILSFGQVDPYRVHIARGQVKTGPISRQPSLSRAAGDSLDPSRGLFTAARRPRLQTGQFPQAWKTRLQWEEEELQAFKVERSDWAHQRMKADPGAPAKADSKHEPLAEDAKPKVEARGPNEANEPKTPELRKVEPKPAEPVKAKPAESKPAEPQPVEPQPVEPKKSEPEKDRAMGSRAEPRERGIQEVRLTCQGLLFTVREPGAHLIGRGEQVPLRIDDKSVSRVHARLHFDTDRETVTLQDLGSSNGTLVDGKPADKPVPLADGDLVTLGQVELVVRLRRE